MNRLHRCVGCKTLEGVFVEHLRNGGSYAICSGCWERGRKGWYRVEKARRIAAVEQVEAAA